MQFILAILGQTKFGKSTMLALLTNIFLRFLRIFSKTGGRTKTLTEYWYDKENENQNIWIREIVVRFKECLGGVQDDVNTYNDNLEKNPVLVKCLGLEPLETGTSPKEHLKMKMESLKNHPMTDEEIKKLLCTKGLDTFIKKIVLRVPANDILKSYMQEHQIQLSIRDTKGLLDLSMDEKLEKSNGNLSEIGLDNIDGAVFGCSDSYPNMIQEIYADTLRNVFKSVPTFMMAKDPAMLRSYGKSRPIAENDVESFINDYQNGKNDNYLDMDEELFWDTNKLFYDLGIMASANGVYSFTETYFNKCETEFIIPLSTTLKKYSTDNADETELTNSHDFMFLQMVVTLSIIKMVNLITDFRANVERLKTDGHAQQIMKQAAQNIKKDILMDFDRYDNDPHGNAATTFCKPQLKNIFKTMIEQNIDDPHVDILGSNGGITTRNNGKLRYFATAVVAVSARRWLDYIISNIEVTYDICDANGNVLFNGLIGKYDVQTKLVKNILRNCLYKNYTDTEATIQYYLCVNRNNAAFGIRERRNAPTLQSAFEQTIEIIVNDFCRTLC